MAVIATFHSQNTKADNLILVISFNVGDIGYPQSGDSVYQPVGGSEEAVLAGLYIQVYRDGDREHTDEEKGILFNATTGTISFYPALHKEEGDSKGEEIIIEAYAIANDISFDATTDYDLAIDDIYELSIDDNNNLII